MTRAAGVGLLMLFPAFALAAGETRAGDIRMTQPWSLALPPVSANGAVYLSLSNTGRAPDKLVGGSTPMAERVELHTSSMDGGIMRMRQISAVDLEPGGTAVLEPGGTHLMLVGLKEPLEAGKRFPLMLEFERSGMIQVEVAVQAAAASAPMHGGHSQPAAQHGHGGGHGQEKLMHQEGYPK